VFVNLTNELIRLAEQAHLKRDVETLDEVSQILMSLPVDAARQIGLYYHALAIYRRGQIDEADVLLETVADTAPITYRARAIQALGANYHCKGELAEVLRFQLEALRMASDKHAHGLQTTLIAHMEISFVRSDTGDHKGALAILENVLPLVHGVAKQSPFYFYVYHNELAIELGELGQLAEAKAASDIAIASPYAPAYPNWAETRQELEAKRTSATPSVVAVTQRSEAIRAPRMRPRLRPKIVIPFCSPARAEPYFQRSIIPIPATATNPLTAISILHRMLICIGSRAPPA